MTPELKQKWLNALRSGRYHQGRERLHNINDTYCCLGVLCDIAGYEWKESEKDKHAYICQAGEEYIENSEELEKLGLSKEIHDICYDMNDGTGGYSSLTFLQIADWLEKENF